MAGPQAVVTNITCALGERDVYRSMADFISLVIQPLLIHCGLFGSRKLWRCSVLGLKVSIWTL